MPRTAKNISKIKTEKGEIKMDEISSGYLSSSGCITYTGIITSDNTTSDNWTVYPYIGDNIESISPWSTPLPPLLENDYKITEGYRVLEVVLEEMRRGVNPPYPEPVKADPPVFKKILRKPLRMIRLENAKNS